MSQSAYSSILRRVILGVFILVFSLLSSCKNSDGGFEVPAVVAAQSAAMAAALAEVAPHITADHLETRSGAAFVADADGASDDPATESILISTGLANAGGVGSTDREGDGEADTVSFEITLDVPAGMGSLAMSTRFITSELVNPIENGANFRENDIAKISFAVPATAALQDIELAQASSSFSTTNEPVQFSIDVSGASTVKVRWSIEDVTDGLGDSALRVSNVRFSAQPSTGLSPPDDEHLGGIHPNGNATMGGEGGDGAGAVNLVTGSYFFSRNLLFVPAKSLPFQFLAMYSSSEERSGALGEGWRHHYEWHVERTPELVRVVAGDGSADYFIPDPGGNGWVPRAAGVLSTLTETNGAFTYTNANRLTFQFATDDTLMSISDVYGETLTLGHDAQGRLTTVLDTRNQTATFTYDAQDRLTIVDYHGLQAVSFTYDANGRLESIADANGDTTSFTYDAEGLLETATDPVGTCLVHNCYENGRVCEQTFGNGGIVGISYEGSVACTTDPLGRVTEWEYDARGRLGKIRALGVPAEGTTGAPQEWTYTYDQDGNIASETDPLGNTTSYTYDDRRNRLSTTDAMGNTTTYTYDADDQMLTMVDATGATTTYTYEQITSNLLTKTDPMGNTVSYTYDGGNVTSFKDRRDNTWNYGYSLSGDLASVQNAAGDQKFYSGDGTGNLTIETDFIGNNTAYFYDAEGNLLQEVDHLQNSTTYTYDENGNNISAVLPGGGSPSTTYGPNGEVLTSTNPDGETHTYAYNAKGKLQSKTDPLGRTTFYDYDIHDRIDTTLDPMGGTAQGVYDAAGRLQSLMDPNGNLTTFQHDALGRVTAETDALGNTVTNTYDVRDQLVSFTNARGQQTTRTYDAAGRLKTLARGGLTVTNQMDQNGNNLATQVSDGTSIVENINRSFDDLDRVILRTDPFGNTIHYTYDAVGNLASIQYSDGKTVTYGYDALNRMTSVTDWEGRTTHYLYGTGANVDRLIEIDHGFPANGTAQRFEYDATGRLLAIDNRFSNSDYATVRYDFVRDGAGRITGETASIPYSEMYPGTAPIHVTRNASQGSFNHDAGHRVDSAGLFGHDADGNMTAGVIQGAPPVASSMLSFASQTATYTYDDLDRLIDVSYSNGESIQYAYDAAGNITQVDVDDGQGGTPAAHLQGPVDTFVYDDLNQLVGVGTDTFVYDSDGFRIQSTIGGVTRRYVHNAVSQMPSVLEEHDQNGNILARYVWGLGLILREEGTSTSANPDYVVYHYDLRGSTTVLTDENGQITDRYVYGPYGRVLEHQGSTPNPFTYCGRDGVMDDGNGLYFMRTRYYSPTLMRFLQKDGSGRRSLMETQSWSPYVYVQGNPIVLIDPNGQWGFVSAFVGAVVNVVVTTAISLAVEGEWPSTGEIVGAAIEGAIVGAGGGSAAAWFLGAGLGDVAKNLTDGNAYDEPWDYAKTVGKAAISAGAARIMNGSANKLWANKHAAGRAGGGLAGQIAPAAGHWFGPSLGFRGFVKEYAATWALRAGNAYYQENTASVNANLRAAWEFRHDVGAWVNSAQNSFAEAYVGGIRLAAGGSYSAHGYGPTN